MRIMFDNNEQAVLLNALELLADELDPEDEDQQVVRELLDRISTAGESLP